MSCKIFSLIRWVSSCSKKYDNTNRHPFQPHEKLTALMETDPNNLTIIRTAGISQHEKENIGLELDMLKVGTGWILMSRKDD